MPSTTPKQKKTMAIAAKNPAFAKKVGIPQSVAQEFYAADEAMEKQRHRQMGLAAELRRKR